MIVPAGSPFAEAELSRLVVRATVDLDRAEAELKVAHPEATSSEAVYELLEALFHGHVALVPAPSAEWQRQLRSIFEAVGLRRVAH